MQRPASVLTSRTYRVEPARPGRSPHRRTPKPHSHLSVKEPSVGGDNDRNSVFIIMEHWSFLAEWR